MSSRPSNTRRQIREAVVQLLYSVDSEHALPSSPDPPVLDLLLEPLRERATRARAKAVLHLQQGRTKTLPPLTDLLRRLARVDLGGEDSHFPKALRELHEAELQLGEELDHLKHEMNGARSAKRLTQQLDSCRHSNLRSKTAAAKIQGSDPTFPALRELRSLTLELWDELRRSVEKLDLALAREPGPQSELRAVVQAENAIEDFSNRVSTYLDVLRSHLEEVDAHLAHTVDNYSPDRIDRVDRAILRLAACEILFDPEVPAPVAINEAIELARSFGTTDSPRFVNGVLDRLRKAPASDQEHTL